MPSSELSIDNLQKNAGGVLTAITGSKSKTVSNDSGVRPDYALKSSDIADNSDAEETSENIFSNKLENKKEKRPTVSVDKQEVLKNGSIKTSDGKSIFSDKTDSKEEKADETNEINKAAEPQKAKYEYSNLNKLDKYALEQLNNLSILGFDELSKNFSTEVKEAGKYLRGEIKELSGNPFDVSELFSSNVKLKGEFIRGENGNMSYYIMYPEGKDPKKDKLPTLIYLHGSGQSGQGEQAFLGGFSSPGYFMKDYDFDGCIVCPVLPGKNDQWASAKSAQLLDNFLEDYTSKYNAKDGELALAGVSLGGNGVLYMINDDFLTRSDHYKHVEKRAKTSHWFKKAIAISSPMRDEQDYDLTQSKVPLKVYYGTKDDDNSRSFLNPIVDSGRSKVSNNDPSIQTESVKLNADVEVTRLGTTANTPGTQYVTHTHCASRAFKVDQNNDGHSDALEWLFA